MFGSKEVGINKLLKLLIVIKTKLKFYCFIIVHYLGDFVIVEPITEGNKVQAEIIHILYPMQIKHLKDENKW